MKAIQKGLNSGKKLNVISILIFLQFFWISVLKRTGMGGIAVREGEGKKSKRENCFIDTTKLRHRIYYFWSSISSAVSVL